MAHEGKSVTEILESWDKAHAKRAKKESPITDVSTPPIGGPNAVVDPPHRRAKVSDINTAAHKEARERHAAAKGKPSNRTKVVCPLCGESYNGRATWVKNGDKHCYRCKTKKGGKS